MLLRGYSLRRQIFYFSSGKAMNYTNSWMTLETSLIKVSKIHLKILENFQILNLFLGMHHAASKMIHEEANRRSEKWNGILIFVLMKIMPFLASIPTFIVSFFNYFTTELDGEAFQFVLPLW